VLFGACVDLFKFEHARMGDNIMAQRLLQKSNLRSNIQCGCYFLAYTMSYNTNN
jgi:hypothetical protein